MIISNCLILLILGVGWIQAHEELVWLEDVNNDHERRHLDLGLPEKLEFNLNRNEVGKSVRLVLSENKRLNANAPVYKTVPTSNGKQRLVRQGGTPILTTKFYHDKSMGAAMKVTCNNQPFGACQRSLDGSLNIDGETYELQPEPPLHVARSKATSNYVRHTLRKVSMPNADQKDARGFPGATFKHINTHNTERYNDGKPHTDAENDKRGYNDGKPHPFDGEDTRSIDDEEGPKEPGTKAELSDLLRSLMTINELDREAERILEETISRKKRQSDLLAVEVVVVVDPSYYSTYFAMTSANNGMTREDATEYVIREKLAHVINGVTLRYESIEDSGLDIYVTISKFIIYSTINSTNPLPSSVQVIEQNGQQYVDSDLYIDALPAWVTTIEQTDDNFVDDDHYMVFTSYDLYGGGNTGVLGVAFVKGTCGYYRTSVQEDGGYFVLTSVAAHELGHNLGADHDSEGSSSSCASSDLYIMAPSVTSFDADDAYTVNPWRFSPCSIAAFKSYIAASGQCLSDGGDYFDKAEWELHNSKLPGEIKTLDEQCKLIRGDESGHCSFQSDTTEDVCRTMLCTGDNGYCYYYAAARGTSCGATSANKWCIDGACVARTVVVTTTTTTTQAPTTTTTTQAPTTTTTTQAPTTTTTTQAPTTTTTTQAPTTTTTTQAPTTTTTTQAPTTTTTTQAPTTTTTTQAPTTTTTTQAPTTTTDGQCINIGWKHWTCERVSRYFSRRYDMKPSYWCNKDNWGVDCCEYCAEVQQTTTTTTTTTTPAPTTQEACVDKGYNAQWPCRRVSRYFRSLGVWPSRWCKEEQWQDLCCKYCEDRGF